MRPKLLLSTSKDDPSPYVEALTAAGADVTAQYCPQIDTSYDGLVLCGGSDLHPSFYGEALNGSVNIDIHRDETEFALLRSFLQAGKPIFGICRGCQLLNVYFGGTLHQHLPTAATHSPEVYGNYLAHDASVTAGSYLEAIYGSHFPINSHHHQGIKDLAPELQVTMIANDGVVEGIRHSTLPVWAVQWHPEKMCLRFARPDTVDGLPVLRSFVETLSK